MRSSVISGNISWPLTTRRTRYSKTSLSNYNYSLRSKQNSAVPVYFAVEAPNHEWFYMVKTSLVHSATFCLMVQPKKDLLRYLCSALLFAPQTVPSVCAIRRCIHTAIGPAASKWQRAASQAPVLFRCKPTSTIIRGVHPWNSISYEKKVPLIL
jgi:hypothetical protein